MSRIYDVVIVGAGPGGSATAYYLAKQERDVLLLDKSVFPRDKTCGDALTPRALHVLADMGILEKLSDTGCRINGIDIIAPNGRVLSSALPPNADWPDYSLVVPRLITDDMIREQAIASGAAFESGIFVNNISPEADCAVIKGECDGQPVSFKARLVIIATGANIGLLTRIGLLKKTPKMMLAARAYFESMSGLPNHIQMHFGGVPLPGYGWIFPLSESSANIGIGLCPVGLAAWWLHAKPKPVFDQFIQTPPIQRQLNGARQTSPIKGYPLRTDFASAPTFGERVLLVGEAAGLVNPLTGEGVDYALASGKLAAEHVTELFAAGNFSREALAGYDVLLRQRFQKLFIFCNWTRDLLMNAVLMDWLVKTAIERPALKLMLMRIVLGHLGSMEQ